MRIFALEYFRQIINSDDVHFMAVKKKTQFKVKSELGPFIFKKRQDGPEEDNMLQELKLTKSFMWQYDPHGVIREMRTMVN